MLIEIATWSNDLELFLMLVYQCELIGLFLAGFQFYLATILTQCLVSGLGRKIFVQSPKLLALLYDTLRYYLLWDYSISCMRY